MKSQIFSTSGVSIKAHCNRTKSGPVDINMSPFPINCSAPLLSRIVLESVDDVTLKAYSCTEN